MAGLPSALKGRASALASVFFLLPAGNPARFKSHPRRSSGWADIDGEDVLGHRSATGADEVGAADAAGRIDGPTGAASWAPEVLRRVVRSRTDRHRSAIYR